MMSGNESIPRMLFSDSHLNSCDKATVSIPAEELSKLMLGVAEAFHAAAQGNVSTGYRMLCDGLFHTRELDAAWTADVTQLWSLALAHFIKRHPASWFAAEV
jgi:hypothetical protein